MPNISSLNFLLRNVKSGDDLAAAYNNVDAGMGDAAPNETQAHVLYSCSNAAQFVIGYFTKTGRKLSGQMAFAVNQKELNSNTADALLAKLKKSNGPYVGYLQCKQFAHECVFVRTGSQWAFYQANLTKKGENFTLAPALNDDRRNWCLHDMSEKQFETFFVGLTKPSYTQRLFPYKNPPYSWDMAVYTFAGQNLLA